MRITRSLCVGGRVAAVVATTDEAATAASASAAPAMSTCLTGSTTASHDRGVGTSPPWYDPWMKGPIVGRQAELALIETLLREAADGPRGILLEGAPGIGKSVLL